MSGTGASNYGYGNIVPNSNVNPNYVNVSGSNYPGGFGSNIIPKSAHSCSAPADNVIAASGTWVGGRTRKNVRKVYKRMIAGKRKLTRSMRLKKSSKHRKGKSHKKHMKSRKTHKRKGGRRRKSKMTKRRKSLKLKKRHRMRGGMGYTQYQSNVPFTPGYAVAGVNVAPAMSATANPPPYESYNHCKDNYNHYEATK